MSPGAESIYLCAFPEFVKSVADRSVSVLNEGSKPQQDRHAQPAPSRPGLHGEVDVLGGDHPFAHGKGATGATEKLLIRLSRTLTLSRKRPRRVSEGPPRETIVIRTSTLSPLFFSLPNKRNSFVENSNNWSFARLACLRQAIVLRQTIISTSRLLGFTNLASAERPVEDDDRLK